MAAEAGPSQAVVPAEPEVDLTVHPSGIVPQLQVRQAGAPPPLPQPCACCRRSLLSRHSLPTCCRFAFPSSKSFAVSKWGDEISFALNSLASCLPA